MAKSVQPRVQAMVLCDTVDESSQEAETFTLSGVRSIIRVSSFPYNHRRLSAYLQMSGHVGEAYCRLKINRAETDDVILRTSPRLLWLEGPLSIVPVVFRLRNCEFPGPGVYYVQIYCEEKLIAERPLFLQKE